MITMVLLGKKALKKTRTEAASLSGAPLLSQINQSLSGEGKAWVEKGELGGGSVSALKTPGFPFTRPEREEEGFLSNYHPQALLTTFCLKLFYKGWD